MRGEERMRPKSQGGWTYKGRGNLDDADNTQILGKMDVLNLDTSSSD